MGDALLAWTVVVLAVYALLSEARSLIRHFRVKRATRGMPHGAFIRHGMVEDKETRMLKGQRAPSERAWRCL